MLPNAAPYQLGHTPKMIGRHHHPTKIKYITLFRICQVLLTVKIIYPAVGIKVGAEISVGGDYDKFVSALDVINVVAVLFFDLVESVGIGRHAGGCLFVFLGGGEAHIDTVLLIMLVEKIFVPEFERRLRCGAALRLGRGNAAVLRFG